LEILWKISPADVNRVRAFVANAETDGLVRSRRVDLTTSRPMLTRGGCWHALVGCLLTTQQKSGPESPVARFIRSKPFLLDYEVCRAESDLRGFITRTLTEFGGIRRSNRIAAELDLNLKALEGGRWAELLDRINSLLPSATRDEEHQVAEFLDDLLIGLGPKQSRNLLLGIGFTRYEIPIDSRLTKWLNEFGFPVRLNAIALSDRHYYRFVSSGIQQLCAEADVLPCILDAAIFASFDKGGWNDSNTERWGYAGS
jgi:hypothetical protein